jgi:hypothetical protein
MASNRFGSVLELQQESFVHCIDYERPDVRILIHLYDQSYQASRLVNDFFTALAPLYPSTKFCRIEALKADPNFDLIGLPAILIYKGGIMEMSLIRIIDEIPGWAQTDRCTIRDFEEFLLLQELLDDRHRYTGDNTLGSFHQEADGSEDDFSGLDEDD